MEELWQNARVALRACRRAPGFSVLAVLTVACGLGANAAIFGLVNVAFLQPLPFDPDRSLVRVREYQVSPDGARVHVDASRRAADAVADRRDILRASVAMASAGRALHQDNGAVRVVATRVGTGFLEVVGVTPLLGRGFTQQESQAGAHAGVALISHRLWRAAFGGDPSIIGRTMHLDGQPFTVIGVLGRNFHIPYDTDVWHPGVFGESERGIFVLGRIAAGLTHDQVNERLDSLAPGLNRVYPDVLQGHGLTSVPAREYFAGDQNRTAMALMGAVSFLLLIACSNVALLLTTRFIARNREVALRAALGCPRSRQLRQFLVEGLLLFGVGGGLGLAIAALIKNWLIVFLPPVLASQVGIEGIPLDIRMILFTAAVSVGMGGLFGIVAALRASKADLQTTLRISGRSLAGGATRRTMGALVAAEVALAVVLLAAASVMVGAFRDLQMRDRGLDLTNVVTMRVDLNSARYASADARTLFMQRALERVGALPSVRVAAASSINPICCGVFYARVTPDGYPAVPAEQAPVVQQAIVTPGYFEAVGQRLLEGRDFTRRDGPGAEMTVIVDRAFADRFWKGQPALGKRVKQGTLDSPDPWLTVVGVVESVMEEGDLPESWYLPIGQHAASRAAARAHLLVRGDRQGAESLMPAIRDVLRDLDPQLAPYQLSTMDAIADDNLQQQRLGALLTACFAGAGLLLATLGLYGVLSFVVSQDARELGVRVALGASRGDIIRLVASRVARMVAIGLGVGAASALAVTQLLGRAMDTGGVHPAVIPAAAAALLPAVLVAMVIPTLRALRLDPLQALRLD